MDQEGTEQTNNEESNREKLILERILSLKQLMVDGEGGPLELHELGICYFHLKNYEQAVGYLDELLKKIPGLPGGGGGPWPVDLQPGSGKPIPAGGKSYRRSLKNYGPRHPSALHARSYPREARG